LPRERAAATRLRRFLPSQRSFVVGLGLIALAGGAYALARKTSMFAITAIQVTGGTPAVRAQAARAAAELRGTSLLTLDGPALERRLATLPTVVSAEYDRAFPHTLRVSIVPETPTAVLRRGRDSWLVSARGRVMAPLAHRGLPPLPRVWIPRATAVAVGDVLAAGDGGAAARALALASRFPLRVATAALAHGLLVFRLRSGLELRLGEPVDIRLKLAVARRALALLAPGAAYLDVSLPERPVAGPNPQVSGGG
jgi:cell division protein FtsQ